MPSYGVIGLGPNDYKNSENGTYQVFYVDLLREYETKD